MSTVQATNLKHNSSATNNVVLDASGNTTISGNAVVAGTLQANGVTGSVYPLVLGTAVASTSGTAIDFTGIPSWVQRVTVILDGVSTNGTSVVLLRIGAGSVDTTGYTNTTIGIVAGATAGATYTAGFGLSTGSDTATWARTGALTLTKLTNHIWVLGGSLESASGRIDIPVGRKTLSAALDRIRITTVAGTDTFDAGTINIMYE